MYILFESQENLSKAYLNISTKDYLYMYANTHSHPYIYIYIYSSSSSLLYRAGSTDIPDPLSPLLPIVHRPR